MIFKDKKIMEDAPASADERRQGYIDGIGAFLAKLKSEEKEKRRSFITPDTLANDREHYRAEYISMLGIDKIPAPTKPTECEYYAEDEVAKIYRLTVYITDEIPMYAMLFIPHGVTSGAPLIISQHGGGGTPELTADMNGKNNYNHMTQRVLERGAVVIAPQLLLWARTTSETAPGHPIEFNRQKLDGSLKRFGLSITGLEVSGIMRCIDYGITRPEVDGERVGMIGLSYGGYFTLNTAATDVRIKSAFSAGCYNDRSVYDWCDWSYYNAAYKFGEAETAGLCAPRRLYISVGKADPVLNYETAIPEGERAIEFYRAAGCEDKVRFYVWDGGHTVPDDDEGIDFLFRGLENV